MTGEHTIRAFDDDMADLAALVSAMGAAVEAQIAAAVAALIAGDRDAAAAVIAHDPPIDAQAAAIEQQAVRLIALRAPMASDLRAVVAAFKIGTLFERIGDLAKHIARSTLTIEDFTFAPLGHVPAIAAIAQAMVHSAVSAWTSLDAVLARDVIARDRALDALYRDLLRALTAHLAGDGGGQAAVTVTELLFVARNIERIGDNATNVAEAVYYAATGTHLPDRNATPPA